MTVEPTTDAIWLHLSSDLRRFIRRRVPDDHVAEDLLQETFVRVHRNIGTLHEVERLAAWVYRIARNVVHDHQRKVSSSAVALVDAENVSDDLEPQDGCRSITWLDEMIQSLPEGYRQAVHMAEIEERSQQDVADRLGLSLSGAKSRVQRGRAMLKDAARSSWTVEAKSWNAIRNPTSKCAGIAESDLRFIRFAATRHHRTKGPLGILAHWTRPLDVADLVRGPIIPCWAISQVRYGELCRPASLLPRLAGLF
jgi:RNA polymerase sigma-70 factor (ECF subfamily)